MRRLAFLCAGVAAALLAAAPATAVFELGSASPAALGAASLKEPPEPLFPPGDRSLRACASRAALFETPDLAAEDLVLDAPVPGGRAALAWTQVRAPGARESAFSLDWRERTGSPLGLGARVERLAYSAEGASGIAGFAAGARAAARIAVRRVTLEGLCAVDRPLRSATLDRAGVRSALVVGAGLAARGARVRYSERWEAGGERSPRCTVDLPLGERLHVRFGRGGVPGRIGVALAARVGPLEVSWGRLDFATGAAITAAGVAWSPGRSRTQPRRGEAAARRGEAAARRAEAPQRPPLRASLLVSWPFAIMRRIGRIRGRARGFASALACAFAASLLASAGARADSSSVWLPAAREDLESVERLDEPPDDARDRGMVLARMARSAGGAWEARRFAASWRTGSAATSLAAREVSASVLEAGGRSRPTLTLAAGRARLAAGRLAGERAPWLLARRLGLARSYARVPEARAAPLRAVAPVGASAEAADGVAAEWEGRKLHPWAIAGRGARAGSPLAAAGLTARARRGDAAVAAGWSAARPVLSLAAEWRGGWAVTSMEALLARGGPALLATVTSRRSGMEWWCRYRYQSAEARPVAGETGVAARGRRGSARLTWRAWTPASRTDNGALELEGTAALGAGRMLRARLGDRPGSAQGGASPWASGGASHERYALLDVTLARAGSRSLAFLASARRGPGPGRTGRLLGARLRAGAEGSSRVTLLVQASRTDAGAPALGPELTASGQSTLTERSRSGVVLAARGVARRGPLELGGVWEREEGAGGVRPRSASVWVRWFL